jgi:hypothetical protein
MFKSIAVFALTFLTLLPFVPQTPTTLMHEDDFTFAGAASMPDGTGTLQGPAIVFNPITEGIIVGSTPGEAYEMSIPALVTPTGDATYDGGWNITGPVQGLNSASFLQTEAEVLNNTADDIEGEHVNGFGAGGDLLVDGTDLYRVLWAYFDGGTQERALFKTSIDFDPPPSVSVSGPFEIESNQPASFGSTIGINWMNRMLISIPTEWQAALGGDAAVGQFSAPLASQHSHGPNLHVFELADVGVTNPIPATVVLGYPVDHTTLGGDTDQATMASNSTLWNEAGHYLAYAFIEGTATFITAGKVGTGDFCYGTPTTNPALHMTPHPDAPATENWCYAPQDGANKGIYTYPYALYFLLWDINDFVDVKNGVIEAWEVVPYEWFDVTMPHMPIMHQQFYFDDFAYDAVNQRLYLKHAQGGGTDGAAATIWGFDVNTAGGGGGGTIHRLRLRIAQALDWLGFEFPPIRGKRA